MSPTIAEKKTEKIPMPESLSHSMDHFRSEILQYLAARGLASQTQILKALSGPSVLVTMAIGSLIRDGKVRAKNFNGDLVLFETSSR